MMHSEEMLQAADATGKNMDPKYPELKSLYRQALAQSSGEALPGQTLSAKGSVLDLWLAEGAR
ncbi:hypothetical protein SAMN04489760_11414 [Syntrophus gentianae]|uniref:Uncharacterized protein n=1 Tax=Syntrophus gentianae TaxID=43775 RepID=A0A1H7Y4B6_9BACT|nr:hypothetical protein [Syntrophus gentianae]SEM40823.1 hypothetical protein SAMN04489760_11414 [Syntrophus gentianae]